MANIQSKKKNIRKIAKRTIANRQVKSTIKTLAKKFEAAIQAENMDEAKEIAKKYISALDKAAKRCIIHYNKASRHKSAVARALQPKAA